MKKELRFGFSMPFFNLQPVYEQRYRGSEADPRYDKFLENVLQIDVRLAVPHLIMDDNFRAAAEQAIKRHLNEMVYELGRVATEVANDLPPR